MSLIQSIQTKHNVKRSVEKECLYLGDKFEFGLTQTEDTNFILIISNIYGTNLTKLHADFDN